MKKLFGLTVIGLMLVLQTGCLDWKPFGGNLSTPTYKEWSKPGVSELEIKKAMLECGFFDLYNNGVYDISYDEVVLAERCMKKSGFIQNVSNYENLCYGKEVIRRHPACTLPESQVPDRSVERRLNSPYCQRVRKLYPDSKFCTQP